jgi:hypothetical protein
MTDHVNQEIPPWVVELAARWNEAARVARRNGHHATAKKIEMFAGDLVAAAAARVAP